MADYTNIHLIYYTESEEKVVNVSWPHDVRIPAVGESFSYYGFTFLVKKVRWVLYGEDISVEMVCDGA